MRVVIIFQNMTHQELVSNNIKLISIFLSISENGLIKPTKGSGF